MAVGRQHYRDERLPLYRCENHAKYDATCEACLAAHRAWDRKRDRLIGYGKGPALVDATPAQRRLQALVRIGWPLAWLAPEIGLRQQTISAVLYRRKITRSMDSKVRDLYERFWDVQPVGRTPGEKMAISRAKDRAQRCGYEPPMAWDEEDLNEPLRIEAA